MNFTFKDTQPVHVKFQDHEFVIEVKCLTPRGLNDYLNKVEKLRIQEEQDAEANKAEGRYANPIIHHEGLNNLVADVVKGWHDIQVNNEPLEFTRDNLLMLMDNLPGLTLAINDSLGVEFGNLRKKNLQSLEDSKPPLPSLNRSQKRKQKKAN